MIWWKVQYKVCRSGEITIYKTLYKGDLFDDLLHMNWLKRAQVEFLYKGSYFFIPESSFSYVKSLDQADILLQNIEISDSEVEYHTIVNRMPIGTKRIRGLFTDYREKNVVWEEFRVPVSGYVAGGNLIALYFRSVHIANPLDILWILNCRLQLQEPYYSVLFDYLPSREGIIYQLIFRFNHQTFKKNLQEMIQNKKMIIEMNWQEMRKFQEMNRFPQIHKDYQKQFLSHHPLWKELEFKMEFMRPTVFLPESDELIEKVESLIVEW